MLIQQKAFIHIHTNMSCKRINVNLSPKMDDNAHSREKARKIVGKHYQDSDPNQIKAEIRI